MLESLVVLGTRPEVIKLAPVVHRLRADPKRHRVTLCVTGQHHELLNQALDAFNLEPDDYLGSMRPGQTLAESAGRILSAVSEVIGRRQPNVVIVQGDTTSAFCGALAGFYAAVPVAHVEAGLRTGDRGRPYPEETHRVLTAQLADLHFASTPGAASNLLVEGVSEDSIVTTGNTAIDAVLDVQRRIKCGELRTAPWSWHDPNKRLLLLTAHRRESFSGGFERICEAALRLAGRGDVQVVCPLHPNPGVRSIVERRLGGRENVVLLEAVGYVEFVCLMMRAYAILTDSGGVQEEAPALGKPVLVLRETTERPEALEAGAARLTGLDTDTIVDETELLLDNAREYRERAQRRYPFGDGRAADRIADALVRLGHPLGLAAAG